MPHFIFSAPGRKAVSVYAKTGREAERLAAKATPAASCPVVTSNEPGSLTEADFLRAHPIAAVRAQFAGAQAQTASRRAFPDDNDPHDDPADAFRHFYWSNAMTRAIGPERAKAYTDAHEVTVPNPKAETEMDTFNNARGRAFATDPRFRDLSPAEAVKLAMRMGCLQLTPR